MSWDKHLWPFLTSGSGSMLNAAVKGWWKGAAQATVAATKGQWHMVLIDVADIIAQTSQGFNDYHHALCKGWQRLQEDRHPGRV